MENSKLGKIIMAVNITETETFEKHSGDYTLLVIFGLIVPMSIIMIIVCIAMACRKNRNALPYSVAVTNSLLKVIHSNINTSTDVLIVIRPFVLHIGS